MPWKISIFFYLSLGFSLCGFIFPTNLTQIFEDGFVGTFHWINGFSIIVPHNPTEEITSYLNINISGLFLIISTSILQVVSFIELRKAELGLRYEKNLIYIVAFIQLIACGSYMTPINFGTPLSYWGLGFSVYFATMGNKELNLFYKKKGILNAKNEIILTIVLITVSIIHRAYLFYMVLYFTIPNGMDVFSLPDAFGVFPGLILLLILLFYGIGSLIRALRKNKSKLH